MGTKSLPGNGAGSSASRAGRRSRVLSLSCALSLTVHIFKVLGMFIVSANDRIGRLEKRANDIAASRARAGGGRRRV